MLKTVGHSVTTAFEMVKPNVPMLQFLRICGFLFALVVDGLDE
jgi:hypothetical protein